MRVNGVILPTETLDGVAEPLALNPVSSKTYLEWQIYQLRAMRKEPIVILGPDGDDMLRAAPKLADRKLIFSRNNERSILNQIRSGLTGAGTCAFYLPLHVPTPAPLVWNELEKVFGQLPYNSGPHVIQPTFDGKPGYPLLITQKGKDWLDETAPEGDFFKLQGLELHLTPVPSETALQELKSTEEFEEWKSLYTA